MILDSSGGREREDKWKWKRQSDFYRVLFQNPPLLGSPQFVSATSSVMASHALVPLITNVSRFAYLQDLLQVGGAGDEGGVAGVLRAVGGVAVDGVRRRRRRGRGGGRVAVEEF